MIKLYMDATKSQIECIASGDTKVICAELACVIQRMYAGLHQNNPAAAELRINDRDYQKGDTIRFLPVTDEGRPAEHEITDKRYTITHVLTNVQGLIPGYAVLSIREVQK